MITPARLRGQAKVVPVPVQLRRFLHLEKSALDAELAAECLRREWPDCVIHRIESREQFVTALQAMEFDVILSDYSLPGLDESGALELAVTHCPEKPFIFVAGEIGEEKVADLLHYGAADYVNKDRLTRLVPAIEGATIRVRRGTASLSAEALRTAETHLREQAVLLDQVQDAIIMLNFDGAVIYWNKGAEQLYGWAASEVVGRDLMKLLGGDPAAHLCAREHAFGKGEWQGELTHRTMEGRDAVVASRWTPLGGGDGPPAGLLMINTDMTGLRLLESKLLRAQRMESMGLLVGGIAHDLNNVLAPILMAVDLLRTMEPGREIAALTDTMHRSARHGAELVQQLLAFARGSESQQLELDIKPLLIEFVEFMEQTLKGNVRLHLRFARNPPSLRADGTQLKQVLMNLCINARDAMPQGGEITIIIDMVELTEAQARALPDALPGSFVCMTVTDTGQGIAPDILKRIFDPFFTTKATGRGTGLGLSTVRGIVKGHGGFMTVESALGKGAKFKIFLPAVAPGASASPESLPLGTIVLVDDEEMVRDTLSLLLKSEGYRIYAAGDGATALELLKCHQGGVDLLVTDLRMAGMSGYELIDAVRLLSPRLPIIALTGLATRAVEVSVTVAGVRLLAKPMTRSVLIQAVKDALTPKD